MYASFDLNNASPNLDSTANSHDFEGFLNDNAEVTELPTSPAPQANRSNEKQPQKSKHESAADPAPDKGRKQRALEKSREAQKRFRQRQKVVASTSVPADLVRHRAS